MAYLKQKASLEDSDQDEGPQDEDGWLIEDLRVLAYLYSKLKDREQLIDLIFEVFVVISAHMGHSEHDFRRVSQRSS
jgi:hypothetical protein